MRPGTLLPLYPPPPPPPPCPVKLGQIINRRPYWQEKGPGETRRCTVVSINEEHRFFDVRYEDTGFAESFKF